MTPSTFASAAAGNNQNQPQAREGSSEWARRTNGATQTFRRTSQPPASTIPALSSDVPATTANPSARYVPPHRNGPVSDTRYSKEQLLELYKAQQTTAGSLNDNLVELYVGGWQPESTNGAAHSSWGRPDSSRDTLPGPESCWESDGGADPLGLIEMDDEERELFLTSVNTPLKPPTLNMKENQQTNGLPGRKASLSGSATTPGGFGLPSPSLTRGFGRRRETSESYPFPQSQQVSSPGAPREDGRAASPPPSLLRRRTDLKDAGKLEDLDDDKPSMSPFGTLKRNPTGPLSAGFNAPTSPWSNTPTATGVSPMGSFGNFGLGQQGATDKRPGLGSGRAESRFKNVLNKESNEDMKGMERKTSSSNLPKLHEHESWRPRESADQGQSLEEADEDFPAGSATLAANSDISPPHPRQAARGMNTPNRSNTQDDFGFGAFGMTSDNAHGFGQGFLQNRDAFHQTPTAQHTMLQGGQEPMSPSDTNPYKSPEQHSVERMGEHDDEANSHLPGLGGYGQDSNPQFGGFSSLGGLGSIGRAPGPQAPSDRSQTSSAGANRAFGLQGLGQIGGGQAGWANSGGFGTPGRSGGPLGGFGSGVFSQPAPDFQSPSLAGLGQGGSLGQQSMIGGSRMASIFPPAMQDQMRQGEQRPSELDGGNDRAPQAFDGPREPDSPFRTEAQKHESQASQDLSTNSNQPPAPQQRTMVMPDRMRWIYRDPQGQTQGPWSGLEMHDWYKAGFFSPELLVKKFEDQDYEPLAQLIRRIGNSREPFLVPQIGIPHGAPSSSGPNAWAGGSTMSAGTTSAQPPFASSFPSFGTTLTAEQQNALERRKQEEQYLMARQKEYLAQAQIAQRMGGHHPGALMPNQLHHHSSAHSLQSQPSFGSISSPNAYQASPIQAPSAGGPPPAQGFFDSSFRGPQTGAIGGESLGHIREEEMPGIMDRLNIGGRPGQGQFGAPGQPFSQQGQQSHEQQVQQMLQERARLQQEQAEHDAEEEPEEPSAARLQEFQQLQGQPPAAGLDARFQPAIGSAEPERSSAQQSAVASPARPQKQTQVEPPSLTEQVQKAASAQETSAAEATSIGLPQPFPPAPSQSPLPAPAAQRAGRQSYADHLASESRDRSQTPSVETPSAAVAPWAKEPSEAPRGPSLREIQESEAKKAAEAEELAVAARRAAFQKEMEAQHAAATVAAPGLPTSATWAASPSTPTSAGPSPWAKAAQKPTGPAPTKSMAQIQKEEEARKRRLVAQQANTQASILTAAANNAANIASYANRAGKVSVPAPVAAAGGAWTTVGASGKTKTPAPAPPAVRTVSSGVVPTVQAPTKKPLQRTVTTGAGAINAQEEFKRWAVGELKPDLTKGISAEAFVNDLVSFPLDIEMIVEAVHPVSNTIDSRHFAEEFIRRKKLADKGLIDTSAPPKSASPAQVANQGGGWSEVAKKGPAKEPTRAVDDSNGAFRVVAAKKKAGKR